MSGSFAGHLYIWSVKDGTLVKSYQVTRRLTVKFLSWGIRYFGFGFGLACARLVYGWHTATVPPALPSDCAVPLLPRVIFLFLLLLDVSLELTRRCCWRYLLATH